MGDYYDASYETQCPQCRSTKYRNPQMKLMVNVCGHPMCDSCVRMYFIKESAPCPECEIILKRSKFRVQIYEDPLVEKELAIRRKVMKVYNMSEDDFPTLEEWNAYLEEIEEIVYNITNDINKPEMEKKIENYEKQNKNEIRKNFGKNTISLTSLLYHSTSYQHHSTSLANPITTTTTTATPGYGGPISSPLLDTPHVQY
ncbi:CDK-activating kinase assembly factor MAT1 [Portunus trituberculatus]|uniref:CDK-activating kinase assembly factor MAT1 n=1 Tax=Portunus trituberculatus TaxID=210409 RepID=A0A5B7FDZ3_PORTR|nr:CDK-activating kinase assembly factor MAT1 [Portunus trituberculatus]